MRVASDPCPHNLVSGFDGDATMFPAAVPNSVTATPRHGVVPEAMPADVQELALLAVAALAGVVRVADHLPVGRLGLATIPVAAVTIATVAFATTLTPAPGTVTFALALALAALGVVVHVVERALRRPKRAGQRQRGVEVALLSDGVLIGGLEGHGQLGALCYKAHGLAADLELVG